MVNSRSVPVAWQKYSAGANATGSSRSLLAKDQDITEPSC
jgi:hypothetical protein